MSLPVEASPIEDMSVIAVTEPASGIALADGVTIGAVERPTIARTESRRKTSDQGFNRGSLCIRSAREHISQRKKTPFSPGHEIVS